MALARVKTWLAGDTLTAADLNAEFNNILNNPTSLVNLTAAGDVCIVTTAAVVGRLAVGTAGQSLIVSSGLLPSWGNAAGAGLSQSRGLVGATSSQSVTFNADQYLLQTTAASPSFFTLTSTAAFTVNVGTAGSTQNGRDVAAAFSSTFVHFYAISTGSGSTTPAGIASTTPLPTGPVLPTSYSAWAYLTTLPYSSASTTLSPSVYARGSLVSLTSEVTVLNAGAATTEATVSLSTGVPSNASKIELGVLYVDNGAGAGNTQLRVVAGTVHKVVRQAVGSGGQQQTDLVIPNVSQQVFYLNSQAADATSLFLLGYHVPNGE